MKTTIPILRNRRLAMVLYAEYRAETRIIDPPRTAQELEAWWQDCPSQREWLDRATRVRRLVNQFFE